MPFSAYSPTATVSVTNGASAVTAPVIDEAARLPEDIARGATGGAEFSTVVVISASGAEQRIPQRSQGLYRYDVQHQMRTAVQAAAIEAFFQARGGKARGFRFKDWADYSATNEPLAPTGTPTVQLIKTYTSGSVSRVRAITKPVSGSVTLRKNTVNLVGISVATTTGLVTLPVVNTKTITAITKAASAVVTVGSSHGFSTNDLVYFSGVGGMTEINGQVGTVTATAATTITVNINSTSYTTYTTGGTAASYVTATDSLDASYQFDVAVRFAVDRLVRTQQDVNYFDYDQIPLIEMLG
jgi:uncharacterized protein (TIGR02217 family)